MEALAAIRAFGGRMRRVGDGWWAPDPRARFFDGWELMWAVRLDGEAPAEAPPSRLWTVRAPSATTPGGRDGPFVHVATGGAAPVLWGSERVAEEMAAQRRRRGGGETRLAALEPKGRRGAAPGR